MLCFQFWTKWCICVSECFHGISWVFPLSLGGLWVNGHLTAGVAGISCRFIWSLGLCVFMSLSLAFPLSQDILFGLLKQMFQEKKLPDRKKPLKVVVMSATLDTNKFSEFFNGCLVVDIPGRNYPVEERFCGLLGPRDADNTSYVAEVPADLLWSILKPEEWP